MWKFQTRDLYERRYKHLAKKHSEAVAATLANLEKYFASLNQGATPSRIRTSFIHPEPGGVIAIDQAGGGRKLSKLHQIRLYVFPEETEKELIVITIGDKQSQRSDLKDCADFIRNRKAG